ncbi:MAG: hypothetical protein CHACPFDD_00387 [Phycisphaerae bacterium]|nr:hypothetical protein [Phycisphaerae bacterium]
MSAEQNSDELRPRPPFDEHLAVALRARGAVALFPTGALAGRKSPAQPAMFLVYLCGTWLAVRYAILIVQFFGAAPNPGFPWGFLRPIQPGATLEFMQVLLALTLTFVVYARFFYRYNDYLYHVSPSTGPVDLLLDCFVAACGVAVIVGVENLRILGLSLSALFLSAALKYAQGYRACRRSARSNPGVGDDERCLWDVNAAVMSRKVIYDLAWCTAFLALPISARAPALFVIVVMTILIVAQFGYMHYADPAQVALRYLRARSPRPVSLLVRSAVVKFANLSRPYSIPYVALVGVCGVMTGQRSPTAADFALSLLLGPLVWISMLALHDFVHQERDARADRGRGRASWILIPLSLSLLAFAIGLAATASALTPAIVLVSTLFGCLYGILKSSPVVANLLRGCVTATGAVATASICGTTSASALLAAGVGLLDAAGNILGDVRDAHVDRKAGTSTLALISLRWARALVTILSVLSIVALSVVVTSAVALLPLGLAATFLSRKRESHLWFLGVKYACLVTVGVGLPGSASKDVLVCALGLLAIPAAGAYAKLHGLRRHGSGRVSLSRGRDVADVPPEDRRSVPGGRQL